MMSETRNVRDLGQSVRAELRKQSTGRYDLLKSLDVPLFFFLVRADLRKQSTGGL